MKIIALFPIKNEDWILRTTIPQLKLFADEIIALDGGSSDTTVDILTEYGVIVIKQDPLVTNYSTWRQELLVEGRKRGGTHFVWLDADEAFTANLLTSGEGFRERLASMKPGEKLALQWLCLWKSPYVYREDTSVWSNLYKDFIVCDDGKINFGSTVIHEGRTPGPNEIDGESAWTKLPLSEGAVLHFQFVPFNRFQMKQAHWRCKEFLLGNGSARRINYKYSETLDTKGVVTKQLQTEWLTGIKGLEAINTADETAFKKIIFGFFKEKGIAFFEPLQIWHIPELHRQFVSTVGREPRTKIYPRFVILLSKLKNKLLLR